MDEVPNLPSLLLPLYLSLPELPCCLYLEYDWLSIELRGGILVGTALPSLSDRTRYTTTGRQIQPTCL